MALYTGKGDGGTTRVFGCDQGRISKASELPEALGALDEINSFLGLVKTRAKSVLTVRWWGVLYAKDHVVPGASEKKLSEVLREIQEILFIIQAETAGAERRVTQARVTDAEVMIHAIEKAIPPITRFSIAGGTELSAMLDVARTLARRAERRLTAVKEAGLRDVSEPTRAYMNRLSSLLFALARFVNHAEGVKEESPRY